MPYQTLQEANVTGLDGVFAYSASVVPILPALILFGIFLVVTLGSFFALRKQMGTANFAASFAVGGFVTAIVAIWFSLLDGFVGLTTVVVCVAIDILGFIWLIFSEKD